MRCDKVSAETFHLSRPFVAGSFSCMRWIASMISERHHYRISEGDRFLQDSRADLILKTFD